MKGMRAPEAQQAACPGDGSTLSVFTKKKPWFLNLLLFFTINQLINQSNAPTDADFAAHE